jgi:hypothetical protein
MTKPELDWSPATDLRLGRPDLDVLAPQQLAARPVPKRNERKFRSEMNSG